jgi:putative RNA 2'-phosphotransferase
MMSEAQLVRASKFLSKHLRHEPEALGLKLEPGGWVEVDVLLAGCARKGLRLTRAELDEVVERNSKQRFSFDETGTRIRANQGHSVGVDLELAPVEPPPALYHGTGHRTADAIEREGLRKMARHHVHLSAETDTARTVGARHGRPVIFTVDAAAMRAAGYLFYCSANGVWLVDEVPPEYLRRWS